MLEIFTAYKDIMGGTAIILKRFIIKNKGGGIPIIDAEYLVVAHSLEVIREYMYLKGKTIIVRSPDDGPDIIESYI